MRPEIPQQLEDRIEKVYRQAGYRNKGDLVRNAVRQHVNDLEGEYHSQDVSVEDTFDYAIHQTGRGPEIRLTPKPNTAVRFKYVSKGNPPHTTILDTGLTFVAEDEIIDALESHDEVARAGVLTEGAIKVAVAENNSRPLTDGDNGQSLVGKVFETVGNLVTDANQRVRNGEETKHEAYKRAVRPYWTHVTNTSSPQ